MNEYVPSRKASLAASEALSEAEFNEFVKGAEPERDRTAPADE